MPWLIGNFEQGTLSLIGTTQWERHVTQSRPPRTLRNVTFFSLICVAGGSSANAYSGGPDIEGLLLVLIGFPTLLGAVIGLVAGLIRKRKPGGVLVDMIVGAIAALVTAIAIVGTAGLADKLGYMGIGVVCVAGVLAFISISRLITGEFSGRTNSTVGLGFLAGAASVAVAHEGIIFLLTQVRFVEGSPWGMQLIPPFWVPRVFSSMFWGGLWGALFGPLYDRIPGGAPWLKGLIYGLAIAVIGNWILMPLIKGRLYQHQSWPFFDGWDPNAMLVTICIVGGFGLGLGIIYGLVRTLVGHGAGTVAVSTLPSQPTKS